MLATIVIATLLFVYAGYMIIKSVKSVKRSLKGEGCSSCSSDCGNCNAVVDFKLK